MYILRTDEGVMVAKLSNKNAGEIINYGKGEWVNKKYKDGTTATAFVLSEDMYYGNKNNIVIYLWVGYYLCTHES